MFCELWDGLVEKLQFNQMETEERNFLQVLETSKPNIFICYDLFVSSLDLAIITTDTAECGGGLMRVFGQHVSARHRGIT